MDQKLSALIVDDEVSARKLLNKLLEETKYFFEIRLACSVAEAYIELKEFVPDMIFLDIKMPGKDVFTFVHELPFKKRIPGIVFVTAYDQYALQAIKNQAFDYLLKPVDRKELKQCILKFIETSKTAKGTERNEILLDSVDMIPRIRVNTRTGTAFINPSNILYCKADGNYTIICTGEKQHLCSINLGKIEELLPKRGFIRVGRSIIINFEYIIMLDRKESQITLVRDGESATVKLPRQHLKVLDRI
jgi:two-component system, LytTR family, response regulator